MSKTKYPKLQSKNIRKDVVRKGKLKGVDVARYSDFISDAEKLLGRKLRYTVGGSSENHKYGALDIGVNSNNLTEEEYNMLGDLAVAYGIRVGDEGRGSQPHLHVDDKFYSDKTGKFKGLVFDETHRGVGKGNRFFDKYQEYGPHPTGLEERRHSDSKKIKYDSLSFKDAFEQAMKDKGEGETFEWKGKKFLLERAKPKEENPKRSFEDLAKEYANLKTPVESGQSIEGDMPTEEEMNYVPEEEQPSMEYFDPRELELQRLIDKGENLVSKYDTFKDGGRKYQDGSMYGPSDEELMGNKKSFEELAREYASLKVPENVPTPEEMNPQVEETPALDEKEQFVESPMDKSGEYESYKKGLAEGQNKPSGTETEPLTMDKLESDYRKLMEASKEERKTAQWATAATQIASMLDKFSARPVGIKPINFQAQVNPPEIKDLMNLGRMKGLDNQNQQMTPLQKLNYQLSKQRLEETREDRKRKAEQFRDSLGRREREDLDSKVAKVGQNLQKEGLIGRTRAMKDIESYLSDEYKATLDDEKAPDIGGVGVLGGLRPDFLTDSKDVSFRQNIQSLANQLLKARSGAAVTDQEYRRFLREVGSGNFSTEEDLFSGLKKMREDIKLQTRNASKVYGEDVFNLYKDRTGVELYEESKEAKKTFPMTLRKNGKRVTVKNEKDLEEARKEGWQ